MKQNYEQYFQNMYASYLSEDIVAYRYSERNYYARAIFVDEIKAVITLLEQRFDIKLRPDAKFYLLSNLMTMVILPFLLERSRESILDDVASDLVILFNNLEQRSEGRLITGHDIIIASNAVWDQLKIMSNDSW